MSSLQDLFQVSKAKPLKGLLVDVLLEGESPKEFQPVHNVFCPTGPGGGIDPTCSPTGGQATPREAGEKGGRAKTSPTGTYDITEKRGLPMQAFKDRTVTECRAILDLAGKPIGSLKMKGMPYAEEMRKAVVEGREIIFSDGAIFQAAESLRQLSEATTKLPEKLDSSVKRIVFCDQPCRSNSYWSEVTGTNFRTRASAEGTEPSITVYSGMEIGLSTLTHEAAHNLAYRLWGKFDPPVGVQIKADGGSAYDAGTIFDKRWVSSYAERMKSPAENFAESCMQYVDEPERLRKAHPDIYKAVEGLLHES